MSAEDRREGNEDERRELRKLAYEDAARTFAEVDADRLTPKLPLDPPKLQWKDVVGDPQPKPFFDPKQPWVDPKVPWIDPKQPWRDPEPKSIISDKGGFDPPGDFRAPKSLPKDLIGDPEPKSIVGDKGGFDPKQTFDPPKHLLDPPKPQWKDLIGDPQPKHLVDPKHPKGDFDPDPKGIFDPKNIYDPPKLAYDPGSVFDPGRVFDSGRFGFDPGAVARRPFVLGMPHHAPSAGTMAGADPRAAAMTRSGAGYAGGEAPDPAAVLEATLAQVEFTMRALKGDLERLDDYYRELREQYDELRPSEGADDTGEDQPTEDDGE